MPLQIDRGQALAIPGDRFGGLLLPTLPSLEEANALCSGVGFWGHTRWRLRSLPWLADYASNWASKRLSCPAYQVVKACAGCYHYQRLSSNKIHRILP